MTPKERQLAALARRETDRISIDVIHINNIQEIASLLNIHEYEVFDSLGIDGKTVWAPPKESFSKQIDLNKFSEWGTPNSDEYGTNRTYPLSFAESISDLKKYDWITTDIYDFEKASLIAKEFDSKGYAVKGPSWKPLLCQVFDLVGMEETMIKMKTEPALIEAILEKVFDFSMDYYMQLLDSCGESMPIFAMGDDFASQRGLLLSPEDWRKFLKPKYKKIFEMAKSKDKYIWFHSCGNILEVLPDLIEIGIDVWETVQLHTLGITPEKLKTEYGNDVIFFGGINTQKLPFATLDEIDYEVKYCIDVLGRNGGYIFGPDHQIKPDVAPEKTVKLFRTAMEYSSKK